MFWLFNVKVVEFTYKILKRQQVIAFPSCLGKALNWKLD